jgi:hypothetical protein
MDKGTLSMNKNHTNRMSILKVERDTQFHPNSDTQLALIVDSTTPSHLKTNTVTLHNQTTQTREHLVVVTRDKINSTIERSLSRDSN